MKTFKDLKFNQHPIGNGLQARMHFKNNYGVSVVRFIGSYGYSKGLWEVVVLYKNELTYNTEITNDVIGFLNEDEVTEIMEKVQLL